MAKVLLFTDLHIHNHKQSLQRLQDCLDVLRWAFQTARDREIKDVLFLGDLFHDRQKIQVMAYHNTFQVFEEYRDLNIYLLLGNHDLWFHDKWDISSVMPLSALRQHSFQNCLFHILHMSIHMLGEVQFFPYFLFFSILLSNILFIG
jgi:DNA repair exonuclease SbcCD nuclease subunit